MSENSVLVIRPSAKKHFIWYAVAAAVGIAGAAMMWLPLLAVSALILIVQGWKHLQLRFITLSLDPGKLRYETGFFSRSTRTMELRKVQDVLVNQTFGQRLLNTGDLSIETAGETSRLTMRNIDRPREVAEQILHAAHPGSHSAIR